MDKQTNDDARLDTVLEVARKSLHLCKDSGLSMMEAAVALEYASILARWVEMHNGEGEMKDFSEHYKKVMSRRMANGE